MKAGGKNKEEKRKVKSLFSFGIKEGHHVNSVDDLLPSQKLSENAVTSDASEFEDGRCAYSRRYMNEWNELFGKNEFAFKLRQFGLEGRLRCSSFRSVCWRVFLNSLSPNVLQWENEVHKRRCHYRDLLHKFQLDPRDCCSKSDTNLQCNHPLSQEEESPWKQYFEDNEFKTTIRQDVVRTFPEIKYFQEPGVQETMTRVLFCYGKKNPHLAYRQGMHELLAPLLFAIYSDLQAYNQAIDDDPDHIDAIVGNILNADYIEHDAYDLFCQLMKSVECYFIVHEEGSSISTEESCKGSTVVRKLSHIFNDLLQTNDPDLYKTLHDLDITPQIFGIRWLRVLFGREFYFEDLLVIWDYLFAHSSELELVDYFVVAMLIVIRNFLVNAEYGVCLSTLMHYPSNVDVTQIFQLALDLSVPKCQPCPERKLPKTTPTTAQGNTETLKKPKHSTKVVSGQTDPVFVKSRQEVDKPCRIHLLLCNTVENLQKSLTSLEDLLQSVPSLKTSVPYLDAVHSITEALSTLEDTEKIVNSVVDGRTDSLKSNTPTSSFGGGEMTVLKRKETPDHGGYMPPERLGNADSKGYVHGTGPKSSYISDGYGKYTTGLTHAEPFLPS